MKTPIAPRLPQKQKENPENLPTGIYEHYKGGRYEVVGIATHSETGEEVVVYCAVYGERKWWVRPRAMFFEHVEIEGKEKPRFRYIGQ